MHIFCNFKEWTADLMACNIQVGWTEETHPPGSPKTVLKRTHVMGIKFQGRGIVFKAI